MKIGILALQGAVQPHVLKLRALGVETREVRRAEHLSELAGIILPGGESTTMIHLLKLNVLWEPLGEFLISKPGWGICAGAILMAKEVVEPKQVSLGLMQIRAHRNGYGRQLDSFIASLDDGLEGVFIRAPKIAPLSPQVTPLYTYEGSPVCVEEKHWLATTFHPELSTQTKLHEYFVQKCQGG